MDAGGLAVLAKAGHVDRPSSQGGGEGSLGESKAEGLAAGRGGEHGQYEQQRRHDEEHQPAPEQRHAPALDVGPVEVVHHIGVVPV